MKTEIPISIQILSTSPELFSAMEDRLKNAEVQKIAGLNFIFTRCHREGSSIRGSLTEIYLEERSPWTGEGPPPVGTVCEFMKHNSPPAPEGQWTVGEVRYVSDCYVIIGGEGCEHAHHPRNCSFRPVRTPEQIAAEYQQAAITVIENRIMARMGDLNVRNLAEDLHGLLQEMAVKP